MLFMELPWLEEYMKDPDVFFFGDLKLLVEAIRVSQENAKET